MKPISESELVLNHDGSIYHLHLFPEQIADTILIVGDQGRVQQISQYFDSIEHRVINREFVTHTGYIGNKHLTALSTGIGTDNIDIIINELDALINIDLESKLEKRKESLKYNSTWNFWSCSGRHSSRFLSSIYTRNGNG